jgi:hypothetical protein
MRRSLSVISLFQALGFLAVLSGKMSRRRWSRSASMYPSSMAIPMSVETTLLVQE